MYEKNDHRRETFAEAMRTHGFIAIAYQAFNYDPLVVPPGTIEQRVEFVKAHLISA